MNPLGSFIERDVSIELDEFDQPFKDKTSRRPVDGIFGCGNIVHKVGDECFWCVVVNKSVDTHAR
jgi:hypothetical protein